MVCIWWATFSFPLKLGWSGKCQLVTSLSDACGWPLFWTWALVFCSNGRGVESLRDQRNDQEIVCIKIFIATVLLCNSDIMKIASLNFVKEQREFLLCFLPGEASCCR